MTPKTPAEDVKERAKVMHLLEQIHKRDAEIARLREFVEEVSLPPYRDSDLGSVLRTLRTRALHLLDRLKGGGT